MLSLKILNPVPKIRIKLIFQVTIVSIGIQVNAPDMDQRRGWYYCISDNMCIWQLTFRRLGRKLDMTWQKYRKESV